MAKILLLIAGLIVGIIGVGIIYAVFISPKPPIAENQGIVQVPQPTPTVEPTPANKEYQNEAGFTFSYPGTFELEEKVTDKNTYADVSLTSSEDPDGSINIRMTDTKLKTVADWLKQEKISSKSATIEKASLADIAGSAVTTDTKKQVVAVDQGVLYVMTVTYGKVQVLWDTAFTAILDSFAFKLAEQPETPAAKPDTSGSSGVIDEGEEVVE